MKFMFGLIALSLCHRSAEARPVCRGIAPRLVYAVGTTGTSVSTFKEEQGIHQGVALAATTLLFILHRAIKNGGFTIGRGLRSTDLLLSLGIGVISSVWAGVVFASGFLSGSKPCTVSVSKCLARFAYAPWILELIFVFWIVAYLVELSTLRSANTHISSDSQASKFSVPPPEKGFSLAYNDSESLPVEMRPWYRVPLWCLKSTQGCTDWAGSVNNGALFVLYTLMGAICSLVGIGALIETLWTIGLLSIVSVVVFMTGAAGPNPYAEAPHKYRAQSLRVALKTDHREGTTYVLPCKDRGFDAVWGPKIAAEHREIDAAHAESPNTGQVNNNSKQSSLKNLRQVLSAFNSATELSPEEVKNIASWLYDTAKFGRENKYLDMAGVSEGKENRRMWSIACRRKQQDLKEDTKPFKTHLVGYSAMYALWHAEYLVFMHSKVVEETYFPLFAYLRNPRGSGLALDTNLDQIGVIRQGYSNFEAFEEAVRYVYALFGLVGKEDVDDFLRHGCTKIQLPEVSVIVDQMEMEKIKNEYDAVTDYKKKKDQLQCYIGRIWEKCIMKEESTFAALFAFSVYWTDDIGMDVNKGWHGFPLESIDRKGDLFSWFTVWRQAWYMAVISEFLHVLPIVTSAFISGVLQ
ncbi:hypothetical protein MGU_11466 [Metarhizium guizhouense ARSEF 977]|uniref:Uncharacterized protein n=1 Tax=Metarhizium guizhouense (strain ARSEF 977) TaxID=1276136 RepID=A0A0B4HNZ7_METGA|nr:hypothetical protein MGU_11466 [Metarhizium guizhouense ARSEF 977]